MALDFFDQKALELIGLEVQISKVKNPSLREGFTIGKMIVKRSQIKKLGIESSLQLSSLQDALIEQGYYLFEYSPLDNFILLNLKIIKGQSVVLEQEHFDTLLKTSQQSALTYFNARKSIDNK